MSMSKVGNAQTYEANEQKAEEEKPVRFEEGKENSHKAHDSKDERSIKNRLADADPVNTQSDESEKTITDPLAPARAHGNEPSQGAKIDAAIMDEEAELIKKMDEKKEAKKH